MRPIHRAATPRTYWPVPVALSVVGLVLLTLVGWQRHTTYQADIRLLATFDDPSPDAGVPAAADDRLEMFRVRGYTQRAASPTVARVVADSLRMDVDPDELAARVHALTPLDTRYIDISFRHDNPIVAVRVCNSIAAELRRLVSIETPGPSVPTMSLSVVEPSVVARPVRSPGWIYPVAGLVGGLVMGLGSAALWAEHARRTGGAPIPPTLTARF